MVVSGLITFLVELHAVAGYSWPRDTPAVELLRDKLNAISTFQC